MIPLTTFAQTIIRAAARPQPSKTAAWAARRSAEEAQAILDSLRALAPTVPKAAPKPPAVHTIKEKSRNCVAPRQQQVLAWLIEHGQGTIEEIASALTTPEDEVSEGKVLNALKILEGYGSVRHLTHGNRYHGAIYAPVKPIKASEVRA